MLAIYTVELIAHKLHELELNISIEYLCWAASHKYSSTSSRFISLLLWPLFPLQLHCPARLQDSRTVALLAVFLPPPSNHFLVLVYFHSHITDSHNFEGLSIFYGTASCTLLVHGSSSDNFSTAATRSFSRLDIFRHFHSCYHYFCFFHLDCWSSLFHFIFPVILAVGTNSLAYNNFPKPIPVHSLVVSCMTIMNRRRLRVEPWWT